MQIYYCRTCSKRVDPADLEDGRAVVIENQAWCGSCAKEAGLAAAPVLAGPSVRRKGSGPRAPGPVARKGDASAGSYKAIIAALVAVVGILVIVLFMFIGDRSPARVPIASPSSAFKAPGETDAVPPASQPEPEKQAPGPEPDRAPAPEPVPAVVYGSWKEYVMPGRKPKRHITVSGESEIRAESDGSLSLVSGKGLMGFTWDKFKNIELEFEYRNPDPRHYWELVYAHGDDDKLRVHHRMPNGHGGQWIRCRARFGHGQAEMDFDGKFPLFKDDFTFEDGGLYIYFAKLSQPFTIRKFRFRSFRKNKQEQNHETD